MVQNQNTPHIPPPNAAYLNLHGCIARILHLSGRGEKLDKFFKDYETLKVLSEDGSSSEVVNMALMLVELCIEEGIEVRRKFRNDFLEEDEGAENEGDAYDFWRKLPNEEEEDEGDA